MQRECEWRVPAGRPLPAPVREPDGTSNGSLALYGPISVSSGGLLEPVARGDYRVWTRRDVVHEDDLRGRTAYGLTLRFPSAAGGPRPRAEATDFFPVPAPGRTPPDTWTPWHAAAHRRDGAFGWREEANGAPASAPPPEAHPIEMRCRWYHASDPVLVTD